MRERWLGTWVVLLDDGGVELGAFRGGELDPTGRLLLEGAGAVTGAVSYRGEYRFDSIETLHGAGLAASDPVIGSALVLSGDTPVDSEIVATELLVKSGAVVRPASGGSLRFEVSGTMTVEAGATIDVTGLGYAGGRESDPDGKTAPGNTGSTHRTGGSHGGRGDSGEVSGTPGNVFDSVYEPRLSGGGGGTTTYAGGAGGGVVELDVGALVLEGEILARGETRAGTWDSGGAGGTITVRASSLTGSGRFDASGGDTSASCRSGAPGAGGGGRIALWVDDLSGFDVLAGARTWGGALLECSASQSYGAAGTIFTRESADTYGRLWLDAGEEADGTDRVSPATELPALGSGSVAAFESAGTDAWLTAEEPLRERWLGTWVVLLDGGGVELGAFRGGGLDPTGRILLEGAGAIVGATGYRGEYRFDAVETLHGAGLVASDPVASTSVSLSGQTSFVAAVAATEVVVESGAVVRPASGGSLRFEVSGTMRVEADATIDVTGLGYAGGTESSPDGKTAPGVSGSTHRTGGSHGGSGGQGEVSGTPGEVFDSVYSPRLTGGGGGTTTYLGQPGGGMVEVVAEHLVLDGSIVARGRTGTGTWHSGGAGGTVVVQASTITGSGVLDASGGDTTESCRGGAPGAGSGGRIALRVDDLSGFDLTSGVRARGGALLECGTSIYATPGTIYTHDALDTHGRLRIDQGGAAGSIVPPTVLPSIGKGTIGAVTAAGADLWIEDADPAKLFSLGVAGMWVRVGGVDYPVIGESADRRQLLLEGAAGVVTVGDAYVGVYKFDSITVTGDAHLVLRDEDETGSYQVDPGSTFTEYDLDPPAVTVASPAAGTLFVAGDPIAVAADVTDLNGVVSVTFRLGDQSFVDTEAPYEWSAVAPVVEVEQDVDVEVEAVDGEGNLGLTLHTIRVRPVAPGDPPVVSIGCPSPGARLAPGTGLDFAVSATHDDGVERVELFVGDASTPAATDFTAPFDFRYDVPADALDGEVVNLTFRARSFGGVYGETVYPVQVVAGNVLTADTLVSSVDTSLDGSSVVVAGGTLTVEGPHTFRDLVVLDGAAVTHSATTTAAVQRLELSLTRDLFLACGGAIDATAKGYPGGVSYYETTEAPIHVGDDFGDGDHAGWQVFDEPDANHGPSNWYIREGSLYQSTNIIVEDGSGQGSFVHWTGGVPSSDYRFAFGLKSSDDDWLGAMFRYVDPSNYYRFGWTRQTGLRFVERVENGVPTRLVQDTVVYTKNVWYPIEIVADGGHFEVWIDGERVFSVDDETHPAGSVGFFVAANAGSWFDDVRVGPLDSPSITTGGGHGGLGGGADGSTSVYGSLFDPRDAGSGGGRVASGAGGGVVRISAAGDVVLDGTIAATGGDVAGKPAGAGGSVRFDAAAITGLGTIDASGGGSATAAVAAGGGGRIALYGGTIDQGLIDRTLAAGGDAATPEQRGAAGTVFVKRDAQTFGDLILDNGSLDAAQPTELLGFPPGVLDSVGVSTVTDDQARFVHDLTGMDVYFEADPSILWPIAGHTHHGQTLTLDTSVESLTALAGDAYAGLYRFDRVIVRGGAEAVTRAGVQSATAPEVEAGSSWTAEHLPSVTLTAPADGQVFTSGSTVTVTAQADDLFGVTDVELGFGSQAARVTAAPYTATFVAPIVSAPTDFTVTATLRDRAGHEVQDSLVVRVDPLQDPAPPGVTFSSPCPREGDRVIPSSFVDLAFTAIDDLRIESYRVFVNGVLEHEVLGVNQASLSGTYRWTVPVDAAPGALFDLRVEARDYGGGVGAVSRSVSVPTGSVLTGDQALDSTWNGTDLTLAAGVFTVTEPLSLPSLSLATGATLAAAPGIDLALDVLTELRVQCGAALDVSALGHAGGVYNAQVGGAPAGVSGSSPDAGGSHGGSGSLGYDGPGPAGEVYDSVYRPSLSGGGGSLDANVSGRWGGAGGGVVDLEVGTLVLDGEIRALGEERRYDYREAGGAGGTVRVVAGQIQGSGSIDVSGGDATFCGNGEHVGAGGGGRVALEGALVGFDAATQVVAYGGRELACGAPTTVGHAAPGTIYVLEPTGIHGDLHVDAGTEADGTNRIGPPTELPALGTGAVSAVEADGSDLWVSGASPLAPRWSGAWMVLLDAAGSELGGFEVLEIDATGRALVAGAGSVVGAASYRGEYRFDAVTLSNGAGLVTSDRLEAGSMLADGFSRLPPVVEVTGDLTVPTGSTVTVAEGGELRLEVGGTLSIESGASLDLSALGHAGGVYDAQVGGAPAGVVGSSPDAGGSHGGAGSLGYDGPGPAGEVYDSVYRPRLSGGGGSLDANVSGRWGGAGGGVVDLEVGTLVLDGEIRALGEERRYDYREAGGAGGTVRVVAGQIQGSGSIDVSGGDATFCGNGEHVGAGGGGRVALEGALVGFDAATQVVAYGGRELACGAPTTVGHAAPGTIYVLEPAGTHGHLRVDSIVGLGHPHPNTWLPTPGAGTVGSVTTDTADPADLWIEPQDPLALFDLGVTGMWLRIGGSDYRVLDQSADRRSVLLDGAAGLVSIGDGFAGVYKFDTVTARGGAVVEFLDTAEITTLDVDADSQVITPQ